MSKRVWIILASGIPVIGLLALLGWASFKSGGTPGGIGVNSQLGEVEVGLQSAADFHLETTTGSLIALSELRGKVVFVDFWASWCAPCRQEAPMLSQVYLEYTGQPVEFVGVNIWDRPQDALDYLEAFNTTYPNGIDSTGSIAVDYGVRGIPEKFFIDQHGVIRQKFVGPMHAAALREAIDTLLLEGTTPDQETAASIR